MARAMCRTFPYECYEEVEAFAQALERSAVIVAVLTTDSREHFGDYAAKTPYFGAAPEALLAGFADIRGLEVHVVSCLRRQVNAPQKIAPNIFYHALLVPKIGWLTTGYQGCIRAVRRKLREIRPNIVHGQGTERDCAMNAVFSGLPNVVTIHGNIAQMARLVRAHPGSFYWLAARLEGLCLRRTEGVFCNSAHTETLVCDRAKRTWRVPNAIRPVFLSTPPRPAAPSDQATIVNVGVVAPYKRQLELLALAKRLHRQEHSVVFEFIGECSRDSAYARAFMQAIKQAESAGYARYLGTKTARELVEIFDQADALVHFPSEESFGLVVAEALARNLKLFAAATGGIVDIAIGCEGAELIPPDDWDRLERVLSEWLSSNRCRPASPAEHVAQYRPAAVAARHVEIYHEVLARL